MQNRPALSPYEATNFVRGESMGNSSIITPPAQRFWRRVKVTEGCWYWMGGRASTGYGTFSLGRKEDGAINAHTFSYLLVKGPIPKGRVLDHLCRVRHCVNPDHLEPVTHRVNLLRGATLTARNAAKTHCPKGHPYSGVRKHIYGNIRVCQTCLNESSRRSAARRRERRA